MKIGILGGGQLARMIIEENSRYGFDFHVLTKEADSPAGRITMFETVGDWNNADTVKEFISHCDVITLENEFIDYHILECIESSGKKLLPGSSSVKMIQDKMIQKEQGLYNGIIQVKIIKNGCLILNDLINSNE